MENLKLELIIAATINFGILFFIFYHFLGERIAKMVEEYKKHIKDSEKAELNAKKRLEKAEKEALKIIEEGRKKVIEIEKSAQEVSKYNSLKIIEKAQKEAEYIIKAAQLQIEKDKLSMESSMKTRILDVALKVNGKIFGKEDLNKELLEKELKTIKK